MIDIKRMSEFHGRSSTTNDSTTEQLMLIAIAEQLQESCKQLKRIADSQGEIQSALISTNDKDGRKGVKLLFEQDAIAGLCREFFVQMIRALESARKFGEKDNKEAPNGRH